MTDIGVSGIYTITNLVNGKIYVGSSIGIKKRFWEHKSALRNNKHCSAHLQKAFTKYGIENFSFELLIECDKKFLQSAEQYWINMLNSANHKYGYNIACVAGSTKGLPFTDEHRKKISEAKRGQKCPWNSLIDPFIRARAAQKVNRIPVVMLDKYTGIEIREFESTKQAAEFVNGQDVGISFACNGKRKTHKGFMWRYK